MGKINNQIPKDPYNHELKGDGVRSIFRTMELCLHTTMKGVSHIYTKIKSISITNRILYNNKDGAKKQNTEQTIASESIQIKTSSQEASTPPSQTNPKSSASNQLPQNQSKTAPQLKKVEQPEQTTKTESILVKDEKSEKILAKFDKNANQAKETFYDILNGKERGFVRNLFLSQKLTPPQKIASIGNHTLTIKFREDPLNPKCYLVTSIKVADNPTKIPTHVCKIQKKTNIKQEKPKQKSNTTLVISKNFLKRLDNLLDHQDGYKVNRTKLNKLFDEIYSYLGRKGTGSSHRSKFGITYANQHGSKELHLGTIRDDLLKFRAMCKSE